MHNTMYIVCVSKSIAHVYKYTQTPRGLWNLGNTRTLTTWPLRFAACGHDTVPREGVGGHERWEGPGTVIKVNHCNQPLYTQAQTPADKPKSALSTIRLRSLAASGATACDLIPARLCGEADRGLVGFNLATHNPPITVKHISTSITIQCQRRCDWH